MQPAIRTQVDELQDQYSDEAGLDCSGDKDMARQEFKEEADVNTILLRFGLGASHGLPKTFGETDYDLDLQNALHAIRDAKAAHSRLPEELKADYPTWQSFLNAVESGRLTSEPLPENPPKQPEG